MTPDLFVALVGFAFAMSISPGPGNFLLLTSGVNFGFLHSLPLILGISCGFLSIVLIVGLGLGQLLQEHPIIYLVLKLICAVYVFWLASKIARMSVINIEEDGSATAPISFLQAALFQYVNPKAWAVALIVTVTYTNPANYFTSLLLMIAVFALVNVPSISLWAVSGLALRRIMRNPVQVRIFNVIMALLLIGSMLPVLLDFSI